MTEGLQRELGTPASESDREALVTRLSEACEQGCITLGELGHRTEAAYRAVASSDLEYLLADLPGSSEHLESGGSAPKDPWPTQWLRGVLELVVLAAIAEGPTYGYEITSRLEQAGLGQVKGGTLYPLLGRLSETGDIFPEWRAGDQGPGRKFFHLTDAGAARLEVEGRRWQAFAHRTTQLLHPTAKEAQS